MNNNFSITVKNKRFSFSLSGPFKKYGEKELYLLESKDWPFSQHFTDHDLSRFLASGDLQQFILEELNEKEQKADKRIQLRVTREQQNMIEKKALKKGYKNTSEFLRDVALAA